MKDNLILINYIFVLFLSIENKLFKKQFPEHSIDFLANSEHRWLIRWGC
jgi:hypothetical protein